jgi:chromate reductase, NAD(P)H dehydrogenase (quinone)
VALRVYDGVRDLPHYDADLDADPADPSVERLRRAIAAADGVLIATPELNQSIPGALKNALDWASRPFPDNARRGKPVAVVGASTGVFGAVWAQSEMRKVLGAIGADVIDYELPIGQADAAFGDNGRLVNTAQQAVLAELVDTLAARAVALKATSARPTRGGPWTRRRLNRRRSSRAEPGLSVMKHRPRRVDMAYTHVR